MAADALDDDARLGELLDVIVALAANELSKRAFVGDGTHVVDGIATGINMLAEELEHQQRLEREHHQRAQHSERLALVGQLAATVAHEVNTPAAYVLANVDAADDRLASVETWAQGAGAPRAVLDALAELRAIGRENVTGIERISSIVGELRGFARRGDELVDVVPIPAVIEDARRLVGRELTYRARLVIDVAPELPAVKGDRARLVQLITNLMLNAAHAIPDGAPAAHLVVIRASMEEGSLVLRVSDTGSGIAEEIRARIFEPFFTTKSRGAGTGLGLAVCAEIVHEHGGSMRFETQVGKGTTFVVTLPATDEPAPPGLPSRAPTATATRARVLIVDDEKLVLTALSRLVSRWHDAVSAHGGLAAREILARDRNWDMVLCDMMMPDLDGPAVHAWIEEHAPELLPHLVFQTGGSFTLECSEFLERFGGLVLDKPISRQTILATIERVRRR